MNQYIGQLLDGRYELLEVIGTGGMAVVYKARCHRLNRLVAVKVLKDEFSADEDFLRRFRAEGEAVAMLSHPNIVQVFDVSASEDANYIVMELIDGISLKQYMEVKGILNWKETLHFATQIAKGLNTPTAGALSTGHQAPQRHGAEKRLRQGDGLWHRSGDEQEQHPDKRSPWLRSLHLPRSRPRAALPTAARISILWAL